MEPHVKLKVLFLIQKHKAPEKSGIIYLLFMNIFGKSSIRSSLWFRGVLRVIISSIAVSPRVLVNNLHVKRGK